MDDMTENDNGGPADRQNEGAQDTTASRSAETKSTSSLNLQDITSQALQFLSTASNEALGGLAVGLAACTYVVLGRVGLILLGGIGGVVLHASWEGQKTADGKDQDRRKENGIDVITRLLDLRDQQRGQPFDNVLDEAPLAANFNDYRPETASALTALVDAIISDYVKWWYDPILPGESRFPSATRRTLTMFINSVAQHLSKKRPADTFLDFLTNSSSIVIVFLSELSNALSVASPGDLSSSEAVHIYLSENPDSSLKTILDQRQQVQKFKMVADDILRSFLDKQALECEAARSFLREILSGVVLEQTLQTCSKPEWINGWIVYLLEEGEPDISQAIDAGIAPTDMSPELTTSDFKKRNRGSVDERKGHQRRVSKAEEAMEEALQEAQRLSRLIAEEDAKRIKEAPLEEENADIAVSTNPDNHHNHTPEIEAHVSLTNGEAKSSPFTNFDQLVPPVAAFSAQPVRRNILPLTLHNANVTILDDSTPNDKGRLRSKPNGDILVQVEPEASQHPGWMIVRKYTDFERLHEVLRRIAQVSGVTSFTDQHATLPYWREHTKASLRDALERYLKEACRQQPLAESEGMKRFLEKDQGQINNANAKSAGSGWQAPAALETMGKGVLGALTSAPKGAAEGGKAVLGGVTNVFGSIAGQMKPNGSSNNIVMHGSGKSSTSLPRTDHFTGAGVRRSRMSEESVRGSAVNLPQGHRTLPLERRPSQPSVLGEMGDEADSRTTSSARSSTSGRRSVTPSRDSSRAPSTRGTPLSSPRQGSEDLPLKLPPPPSEISHDFDLYDRLPMERNSRADGAGTTAKRDLMSEATKQPTTPHCRAAAPLTEAETRVAVELLFAVVNELYTLSSAWNFRRTLLNAAKSYLLRPGNPSLSSISTLIQDSLIASTTSDAGIALHIQRLRQNALPTGDERQSWPTPLSSEDKEKLRVKARRLVVERGLPTALTGVMGQAATGECMGRVFDCIQMEEMARGLVFGLLLQGVRAITH